MVPRLRAGAEPDVHLRDDPDREHFLELRPFGSVPVENGAWGYELSLYLHLNPLRIKELGRDKGERKGARRARGGCAGG